MSENNDKKKIVILICLMILVGAIIVISITLLAEGKTNSSNEQNINQTEAQEDNTEIVGVTNISKMLTVKDCIGKYLSSSKYLDNNTDRDINDLFTLIKIETLKKENLERYYVYGMIETSEYKYITDIYFIVDLDTNSQKFNIEQVTNAQKLEELETDIQIPEIKAENDNTYKNIEADEDTIAKYYFSTVKKLLLGKTENVYELIDTEYRTSKFENISNFEQYISEKKDELTEAKLAKYQTISCDGYIQYVLVDKNEKYYIVNEYGISNFKILLDTYTIDVNEFSKKYARASDEKKVGYNIQKVIDAINDQDYKYIYNKLDSTFRANNFNTLEKFKNYMSENFFTKCSVTYNSVTQSGTSYVYSVTLTDKQSSRAITKNIIMKLGSGTDFTMSFNIE